MTTAFLVAENTAVESRENYAVISGIDTHSPEELARKYSHVILHYVNYGYQPRGVPFGLRNFVRKLRGQLQGRWVTTFHEIYASGPPWKSAFWLRPLQVNIARDLIDASSACVVSNAPIEKVIHAYDAGKTVYLLPIMSNFGEPEIVDFKDTLPRRWVICGGTALVARSLRWFEQMQHLIPESFAPENLDIVGGHEEISVRSSLERLSSRCPGLSCRYYPEVAPQIASGILRQSCFALLDYFGAGKVWPGMLLKSSVFGGLCAHGIVPILSHREDAISISGDAMPGPYYLTPEATNFPTLEDLGEVRQEIYRWYHAHGDARRVAEVYAEALR
jgi:hypothetical protein